MTAQELLKAGRLREAVAAQTEEVKAHPSDPDRRLVLFTLLCFAGELERAQVHLEAATLSDDGMRGGASVYHSLLAAEYERRKVYREGASPVFPPDPPPVLELRLEALRALRAGDAAAAERTLERAAEQAVSLRGKLGGEAFDGLRDYDDVLGQVLEVYAGGRCLWLPMERIRRLEIATPDHQLDLLWAQAELEDTDGEQASVYLPVLYEGSAEHGDDAVRLGRSTEWIDQGNSVYRGAGQKVLFALRGEEERQLALLEVRTLELESSPAGPAE
jgi:type VI secretion system protein ImpE